jgi:hypothetical protein
MRAILKKLSKKQIKKRIDKKCYFCDCSDYELLDVHRIIPGEDGGKYTDWNMLTTCCLCHRKIHAGQIKIIGKHFSTSGRHVIHYINEEGKELWK